MPLTPPTRASLIVGHGKVTLGTYVSQADADFTLKLTPVFSETKRGGLVTGRRWIMTIAELTHTPDGRMTAGFLTMINLFANMVGGTSIFGSSDTPCTVSCSDGELHTILSAAAVGPFTLIGHPEKGLIGPIKIIGIIANALNYSQANSFVNTASGATFADAAYVSSAVLRQTYSAAHATVTGLTAFEFQDGWTLTITPKLEPLKIQGVTRDYRFESVECMVEGIPVEPTTAQLRTAMLSSGTGAVVGREEGASGTALTIVGDVSGTTHVTIPLCTVSETESVFSNTKLRNGPTKFYAHRPYSAGVQSALYAIL